MEAPADDGSFFTPDGNRLAATELTRGPWDPDHQHAGPPSALLTRAIEAVDGGDPKQPVGITVQLLAPIPIATVEIQTRLIKPGKRTDLVGATLAVDERPLMLAQAWRYRTEEVSLPEGAAIGSDTGREPVPSSGAGTDPDFFHDSIGYHSAMHWRFTRGAFDEPGDATAWMRMGVPLLPGEEPSPAQRVMCAVDSASGISARLHPREFLFVNTDLSVVLHRMPIGQWVRLEASTILEPHGVGVCHCTIGDERGPIGRSLQSLYVAKR